MSRELINEICSHLPGTERFDTDDPALERWGVAGRIFAVLDLIRATVTVEAVNSATARMLIETGAAEPGYGSGADCIALPFDSAPDELARRIRQSYKAVVGQDA